MRRLLLLSVLLIQFLPFTQGQSIYSSQHDVSWKLKFSTSPKTDQYLNMVLNQLALAHLKIPEKTSYTFFFNYGASVSFQQGNLLDVSLALTPEICTGDIVVRDFDLQKLLVPASCDFRLSIVDPFKGEVFSSNHEKVPLADLLVGHTLVSFPDSLWKAGSKVEILFRRFGFDEPSYKRIEKELYAIRDYDAAATLADTLEKRIRLARIRRHTPQDAFRTYVFGSKSIYLLNEAVRTRSEIVPGDDPRKLLAKVPVVTYQFKDLTTYLTTGGIDRPVTGNAYLNLARGFGGAISDALKLSQKVDYYSSPFYYKLYSNSTTAGQLVNAMNTLNKFAALHGFKPVHPGMISDRIVKEYLSLGENLMEDGRFSDAVDLMSSAIRFCMINSAVSIPERLPSTLIRARSGLTASYIRIVQKALDNNLTSLADKYLAEAMLYSTRYNTMNAADSAGFAGLYSVLTGKNIQAGNNFLVSKNYPAALAEFDKAVAIAGQFKLNNILARAEAGQVKAVQGIYTELFEKAGQFLTNGNADLSAAKLKEAIEFSDTYPAFRPDPVSIDSLQKSIALVYYNSAVEQAAELTLVHNYEKAVSQLLKAAGLSRDHLILQTALYDSLVAIAGVSWINSLLSDGRLKIWAGEPEKALALAGESLQLITALGLSGRTDIRQQYTSLMEIADETLCNRVKGELTSLINRAGQYFSENKFDDASALVIKARELVYNRAACGINTLEINKLTSRYQHPLRWNEMVKKAGVLMKQGDYLGGIELIQQSGAVFNYYRLDTLGLINTGIFGMAISSSHIPLLKHATGHYIARSGFDEALQLLHRLRQTGVNPVETYELQESLARVLAQRDLAETEQLNLKTMLGVYTNGDKWYRRFTEVYKFYVEKR